MQAMEILKTTLVILYVLLISQSLGGSIKENSQIRNLKRMKMTHHGFYGDTDNLLSLFIQMGRRLCQSLKILKRPKAPCTLDAPRWGLWERGARRSRGARRRGRAEAAAHRRSPSRHGAVVIRATRRWSRFLRRADAGADDARDAGRLHGVPCDLL